jgi:predicted transcriptional regulator of viral defense system
MNQEKVRLFIDLLQSRGKYSFTSQEVLQKTKQHRRAVRRALERLQQKRRIALVSRGFYAIIPLEYKASGILPAEWFIHQLMDYLKLSYYAGLLSAAALHGAAHQKPQEFQVIVKKQLRPIKVNGLRVRFFVKKNPNLSSGIVQVKTETGYIRVSGPELTAIDLMKYAKPLGGLNNIATIISELGERISTDELIKVTREEKSMVFIQRLGYLLDQLGFESKTDNLAQWLSEQKVRPVLLDPAQKKGKFLLNKKWKLFENQTIEAELP